jgi:hypothetical protein
VISGSVETTSTGSVITAITAGTKHFRNNSMNLPKTLIVAHLVNKSPYFCGIRGFISLFTAACYYFLSLAIYRTIQSDLFKNILVLIF